jgi:hypothetical protein
MSYYYGENIAQFEKSRFLSGTFRFVAACPPIIAASLVSDLGSITDYTGSYRRTLLIACYSVLSFGLLAVYAYMYVRMYMLVE